MNGILELPKKTAEKKIYHSILPSKPSRENYTFEIQFFIQVNKIKDLKIID